MTEPAEPPELKLDELKGASRLLVEAQLRPVQGERFQPTGFPDQGAALYRAPRRKPNGEVETDSIGNPVYEDVLLVESAQSMANRMERACWDDGAEDGGRVGDYNGDCKGIPYVLAVDMNGEKLTASPLEAHRLASPYIWDTQQGKNLTKPLPEHLREKFGLKTSRLVPWRDVAKTLLEVDPGCLLHGVWFSDKEFSGGKVRLTRALTGYIEARSPQPANYGFQKRDPVSDRTEREAGQTAETGYGSVIGPMQDFTSPDIRAFFQLDVERLRSYGLPHEKLEALLAWAIYKIWKVLSSGRDAVGDLRTRCKFEVIGKPVAKLLQAGEKPESRRLPKLEAVKPRISILKKDDGVIQVKWVPKIEGKADLGDVPENDFDLSGFGGKVKIQEEQKSKRDKSKVKRVIISGEFTKEDEERLLKTHSAKEKALQVIEKAVKAYRDNYQKKVAGIKPAEEESQEGKEAEESM
ncbi:MAG: type I-U CRISPR-associated RAMP protein Csb1/Cas7u [Halobacteria archaeon]